MACSRHFLTLFFLAPVLALAPAEDAAPRKTAATTEASREANPLSGMDSETLLARLTATHRTVTTVTGTLTQRTSQRDDVNDEARVSKATFAVQFPNNYDLEFTRPDDEEWRLRLCSDGERRWHIEQSFAGTAPDTRMQRTGDGDAELKRLLACLRLDVKTLRQEFIVKAVPLTAASSAKKSPQDQATGIRVTLIPKPSEEELAKQIERITADFNNENQLKRLVLDEAQGSRYEVVIDRAEYGKPIKPELFQGPEK